MHQIEVVTSSFDNYRHNVITQVKHPVTGLLVNMTVVEVKPYGSRQMAAARKANKQLRKTLRTTPQEQWTIDRRATLTEVGYAKLVGFSLSHKYNKPATGKAQLVAVKNLACS